MREIWERIGVESIKNPDQTHTIGKALGSKTRIRILQLISDKPKKASEIAKNLGLGDPAIRYHLQLLREAGLVEESEEKNDKGRPYAVYQINRKF